MILNVPMMAAFAELERDLIHERTMAGLAAARAHHRIGGRPIVMDADKLTAAQARRAKGESPTQIAAVLGVSRATIYRHLATVDEALPEVPAPAPGEQSPKAPPAGAGQKTPQAPNKSRPPRQRWYLVEASSEDPTGPVVVLSTHRTEKAASTARSRARRRATGPETARHEVPSASDITTRLEYDRAVVRDGPPA